MCQFLIRQESILKASTECRLWNEAIRTLVAEASAKTFKTLARARVFGPACWTPPSLSGGLLYIRNSKGQVCCLDLGAEH